MPGPYSGTLAQGINEFDYNGTHYRAGDAFGPMNACETIGFLNAVIAANPDKGFTEEQQNVIDELTTECPPSTNDMAPADAPDTPPDETNPAFIGGDSGNQQGAPTPPVSGTVTGSGNGSGNGSGTGSGSGTVTGSGNGDNPAPTDEPVRPPEGDPHPTHSSEQPQIQSQAGEPVDIFNGAFYIQETDLTIPNTILPLSFSRVYRSGAPSFGPFGWNWDHNYNVFIRELKTGDIAVWRNLHEDIFKFDGANYEPPRGIFEKLEKLSTPGQVYEVTSDGGTILHFERPAGYVDGERIPLLWIRDRHGNSLRFTYGTEDKLAEVRDDDDHYFRFDYDLCGLLVAVSDQSGRKFLYDHDEQTMQLVCVKSPAINDHPQGIIKIYHYEDPWALPELRHNIVRVEDADGNVYLENTYEKDPASWSYARVTEQLYGGYLYQYQYTPLQWVPANPVYINIPAVRVEVMNPDYGVETYTFNYRGDLLDQRLRLSKDKSYRVVAWQYEFDEQGNLSRQTRPDGSEIISIYDFSNPDPRMRGKLLSKELTAASGFPAPSRIIWRGKYEPDYQLLTEEKNESGATTRYKYDFNVSPGALTNTGKLREIIHPDTTLPDGSTQTAVTRFEYNSKAQLTGVILPDGVRNEFEYGTTANAKSRLIKQIFDAAGLHIEQKLNYDGNGFNLERIDGNGNTTRQIYNALGLIERSILPPVNGIAAEYISHYNGDKKLVAFERPKGTYTDAALTTNHIKDLFERDVLGYPVKYKWSSNTSEARSMKVTNDFRGFPLEIINPDGSRLKRTFDERGLLLTEEIIGTDGTKITSKKVYDRAGKVIREEDPLGRVTLYEYDGFSRTSKITYPNGTVVKQKWLKNDLLESEETIGDDSIGTIRQLAFKSYEYDEKNRLIKENVKIFTDDPSVSSTSVTTYYYDPLDRLIKTVNNRGGVAAKEYDGLGRLVSETDFEGNKVNYFYDNSDNLVKTESHQKEPDGSVSVILKKFGYDSRNRQIEVIEPDGAKFIREYDDRNLVVKETDYMGIITERTYNSFQDKITEVLDAGGLNITHRWTINNMSQPVNYTDPKGQVSNYYYDAVGRTYKVEYPNGFSSTKAYNARNQVTREQLSSGVVFDYSYDASNRLQKITNSVFPAPLVRVEDHLFTYDGLDRLINATTGTDVVTRKYDSTSRLISETTLGTELKCTYNDAAGSAEKIWPDGRKEKFSFDLNGSLSKIEETTPGSLGSGISPLGTFRPSGPFAIGEAILNAGLTVKNAYDERKRLTDINITSLSGTNENLKYRYNTSDIKEVEALSGQNPKLSYFEFDNRYRLLNAYDTFTSPVANAQTQAEHDAAINQVRIASAASAHKEQFLYNSADARTQYSESGSPVKNYTFLPGHKIQSDGTNTYAYHPDGTLKSDGIFSYEADALGRIVKILSGTTVITEIQFDALGRPAIIKESGKPVKSFNYLGSQVLQENESGNPSRQITRHPLTGVPVAYHSSSGTHYTLFDARYNLVGLLDSGGNLVETYRYKSFGQPRIFNSSGAIITSSGFGVEPIFGGMRYLPVTGLYLTTRRLMNPVNGVFLSADPKGYVNSSDLYVYVRQNPIEFIDPEGEIAFLGILAVMAVGALVAGGLNAIRQGIAIAEGSQEGWEWGQFGLSVGLGAVAAPLLVVAPELAVPLAAWGVAGGISQISQGHYGTGAFDIVTSLAPFGFKGPRNATFGPGTRFGQRSGLGPSASWGTRFGRFTTIENNLSNYVPTIGGRRIGVGFAPTRVGQPEGHVSVVFEENPGQGTQFLEKNAMRLDGDLRAWFNQQDSLPEFYFPDRYGPNRPFSYEWVNIPRWNWSRALGYGTGRIRGGQLTEPFSFDGANCSNFVSDVLGQAGINGMSENSSAGALARNFGAFARSWPSLVGSGYSAPFFTSGIQSSEASAAEKK